MPNRTGLPKLGIVSTYLPRRCGLATYTADLRQALQDATDDMTPVVVAIDRDGLQYGTEVVATIRHGVLGDYAAVADTLVAAGVGVVLIQHEYGIFGGSNGSHVLGLAAALTERGIPYLVTLHTLLSRPSPGQLATLRALCAHAARITVFTETARQMVIRTGIAANHQIAIVPHGAPVALQTPPERAQLHPDLAALLDSLRGKPTLTTFGLLSEGKGIDLAISALAGVVVNHPDTQYVIAGATHPEIVRQTGESYRANLHHQVDRLGLTAQVHFLDDFLTEPELSALLNQTTIFVTPYRSPEQVCSGALTFALAAGRPVVSTAYQYAEDMLRYGAGRVVACGDVAGLNAAISGLLGDPLAMADTKAAAELLGAKITWPAVALRQADLVREVLAEAAASGRATQPFAAPPRLRLDHLDRLTDEIGIIQFASNAEPDLSSGYCVDDVARLAIVASGLLSAGLGGALAKRWVRLSVRFLDAAHDPDRPGMRNMLSYGGSWLDEPHVGDHVGRAMWSLGVVAANPVCPDGTRRAASALLDQLVHHRQPVEDMWLRTVAYTLLGLARAQHPASEIEPLVRRLDDALTETCAQAPDWRWFEPTLTYDNARLPQAMLAGAVRLGDSARAARAVEALDWYTGHVGLSAGMLRCVGNVWHRRDDDPRAWADDGDEQPIDASGCAEALVEAWQHTADPRYARLAGWAYSWFLGRNRGGARLYAEHSGGCHDGLSVAGPNPNQGAESTLAYYQALLSLVNGGLAKLRERTATGPERSVAMKRTSTGSVRPGTSGRGTPQSASATPPTASAAAAGTATTRGDAPPRPPATGPTHVRPGNRFRITEDPTDAC
jgi:glycosyltransferase involved in cell wall biosynthesis